MNWTFVVQTMGWCSPGWDFFYGGVHIGLFEVKMMPVYMGLAY